MALVNRSFNLDITPGAIPQVVKVSEYDQNRQYTVTLIDEGGEYEIPSGTTATVEGSIGGNAFSESATVSGNTITFTLTESMTALAGDVWCKIKLTKDSKPIQTAAFVLRCDKAGVEAETVIGASGFEEQINDAVEGYLDDHQPFFTLPSGGQSGQALLSDGADGAFWGEQEIPSGGVTASKLSNDVLAAMAEIGLVTSGGGSQEIAWDVGNYYGVFDGNYSQSENYVSTPFISATSLSDLSTKITNFDLVCSNTTTRLLLTFRKNGVYAGAYYNQKYYVDRSQVTSVDFDEATLTVDIREYPNYRTTFRIPGTSAGEMSFDVSYFSSALRKTNKLYEKKFALFGDSITYWDGRAAWYDSSVTVVGYPTYMRNELGVSTDNFGVAGAQMPSICNTLKSKNFANYDCIILTGGTNDANNDASVETFSSAVVSALQYAYTSNPKIKIFLVSAPQMFHNNKDVIPYCEALEEIGNTYGVPCLRLDQEMQINEFNQSTLTVDGIHPNNDGYKLYADVLIPFLLNH